MDGTVSDVRSDVRLSCFNSSPYFEMWHLDSNDTDVFHVCKE